jgi:hypothetical protein
MQQSDTARVENNSTNTIAIIRAAPRLAPLRVRLDFMMAPTQKSTA